MYRNADPGGKPEPCGQISNFWQSSDFGSNFGKTFFLGPSIRLSSDVRQPVEMKLPSGPHHSMNLCEHDRPIKDDRRYGTDMQTDIYDLTVSISQVSNT
jgi:hypothetical protein